MPNHPLIRAGLDAALSQQVVTIYATLFSAAVTEGGEASAALERARRGLTLAVKVHGALHAVVDELS
jgi:hypothetical protein